MTVAAGLVVSIVGVWVVAFAILPNIDLGNSSAKQPGTQK
jgi:hypothetical protein